MTDDRTHGADSAINDEEPMTAEEEAAFHEFNKLADIARKVTEDHLTALGNAAIAPTLDSYNKAFAILCGAASAVVTGFVGASDIMGLDTPMQIQNLNKIVEQMSIVFNQIQERKASVAAFNAQAAGATKQ